LPISLVSTTTSRFALRNRVSRLAPCVGTTPSRKTWTAPGAPCGYLATSTNRVMRAVRDDQGKPVGGLPKLSLVIPG